MRFSWFAAPVLTVAATLLLAPETGGCSSANVCSDYSPPAGFDATTPTTSLKNDVFPIFQVSCAFSSCHGATDGTSNGIFLGGNDPSAIRKNIVNVRSSELGTMNYVTPGDPRNSYMMRKMDSSQCVLDAQCTGGSCQDSMPKNSDPLDVGQRDTVRRWIQQGALDN